MAFVTHGIRSFMKTGAVHPDIQDQESLKRILNKTERDLRAAAVPGIKSDLLIDLVRFDLTIIGLYSLYMGRHGILKGSELKKGHMAGHDILKSIFAAVNSVGRLLDRVDWLKGKEGPQLDYIIAEIKGKRKKNVSKGKKTKRNTGK